MGQPTKLTPALQEQLVNVLRTGVFIDAACHYVGIAPSTYYGWMDRGRKGDEPYVEFLEAVEKARASATVRAITLVQKAAEDSWQAAAWYLERSHPDQYGRRTNIAGPNGGPVQVETDEDERTERLRAIVEQALEDARNPDA